MRVRIGVSMNYHVHDNSREEARLDSRYFDWLIHSGALPVPLLPFDNSQLLCEELPLVSGVILSVSFRPSTPWLTIGGLRLGRVNFAGFSSWRAGGCRFGWRRWWRFF